jgi:DNA-binding NarL/FixJ family response regulator
MGKLRVLVVADCDSLRRSMVLLLTGKIDVAGAVAADRMMDAVADVDPHVIICSVRTPLADRDPESLWRAPMPAKPFVFVTTLTLDVGEWLDFGRVCVVNEHDLHQDLVAAVQAAAAGEIYLSRRAVRF